MKLGQIVNITRGIFFFKNYAQNETGRLLPEILLFFKKLNMRYKEGICNLVLIYFDRSQLRIQ